MAVGGWDTAQGAQYELSATWRAALIADSATGLIGVMGGTVSRNRDLRYNAYGYIPDYQTRFSLTEAFVGFGTALNLRAGLLDATFDSLAAKEADFEWLTALEPLNGFRYADLGQTVVGGFGAQARFAPGGPFSAALGIENLEGRDPEKSYPFDASGMAGTVIASAQYNTGKTNGKVTGFIGGVRDGRPDTWGLSGFGATQLGNIELLGVASSRSDGLWSAGLSTRVTLDPVILAWGGAVTSKGIEASGSAELGDPESGPSVGVAAQADWEREYSVAQVELRASTIFSDGLKLYAHLGRTLQYSDTAPFGPTDANYLQLGAAWQPTATAEISATYVASSLGGARFAARAEQRTP